MVLLLLSREVKSYGAASEGVGGGGDTRDAFAAPTRPADALVHTPLLIFNMRVKMFESPEKKP